MATRVQILDGGVYISSSTNILKDGINSTILLSAIGKVVGQFEFF